MYEIIITIILAFYPGCVVSEPGIRDFKIYNSKIDVVHHILYKIYIRASTPTERIQ